MPRASRPAAGWVAAGLIALHAVLAWLARLPGILTAEDDAKYLLLARSLRHLHYGELWRADHPVHAQYPPVYPAVLAVFGPLVGDRYAPLVLLNILFSCATLWVVWRVARRTWDDVVALCLLAVLALSSYLIERAGMLMSEPLFMLLVVSTAAVLAAGEESPRRQVLAGTLVILAALTRSAGAPFVAAVVVFWALRRQWKPAIALALAGTATVGAWLFWTFVASRDRVMDSYVPEIAMGGGLERQAHVESFLSRTAAHFSEYTAQSMPLVMGVPSVPGTIVDNVAGVGLVLLGLAAGFAVLWKRWRAAALLLGFELLLLLVWPFIETRFLIPIAPLLAAAVVTGLAAAAGAIRPALYRPVLLAVTLLFSLGSMQRLPRILADRAPCRRADWQQSVACVSPDQASFFAAARYVKDRLPPRAVLINAKPQPLFLYSGHASLGTRGENTRDGVRFLASVRDAGVHWILLGSLHASEKLQLSRALLTACTGLAVDTLFPPRTVLFRVLETPGTDSTACRALVEYRRSSWGRDFDRQ